MAQNIDQTIEVLTAAKAGEVIEQRVANYEPSIWRPQDEWDFNYWEYRIAPKKEMTLVEQARERAAIVSMRFSGDGTLINQLADRIDELEESFELELKRCTTDELLDELKRRMK